MFSCPPYSKCLKKLSNFHLHQQNIFWFLVLVFGFSWSNEWNIFFFFSFQTGKKSSLHTWQLKTIGVEAEVLFSKATIWSKHSSSGAWSWLTGILRASTLETLKVKHLKKDYSLICVFRLIHISLQLLYCPYNVLFCRLLQGASHWNVWL